MELAINDGNDEKDENRNDSNRDYPICSHPIKKKLEHKVVNGPESQ